MSQKFLFKFDTEAEAIAFIEGASFSNDSSIDRIKIIPLAPDNGFAVSLIDRGFVPLDSNEPEEETLDYRRIR